MGRNIREGEEKLREEGKHKLEEGRDTRKEGGDTREGQARDTREGYLPEAVDRAKSVCSCVSVGSCAGHLIVAEIPRHSGVKGVRQLNTP